MNNDGDPDLSGDDFMSSEAIKTLDNAFELMTQAISKMQEAVLARDQRVREMEEAMRDMELRVERSEEEARTEAGRLEERIWKVEESVELIERRLVTVEREKANDGKNEKTRQLPLEYRMKKLETSVQNAMDSVLSPAESLLEKMEENSCPETSSYHVSNSISNSPSTLSVASSFSSASLSHSSCSSDSSPGSSDPNSPSRQNIPERRSDLGKDLLKAAEEGRVDDVQKLVASGANPNFADSMQITSLHVAAMKANEELISLLLGMGADISARTTFGNTPLHLAAAWDRRGLCTSLLIDAGSNIDGRGQNGYTPLHWAALEDKGAAVRVLLAAGANKTLEDDAGMTPLDMASGDVVRELLF